MNTKFVVENLKGKTLFGNPRCNWEDNINIDLKGTELEGMDSIFISGQGLNI
jgi:hypothetical protein